MATRPENNSLKYGMNTQNNVSSSYNQAYAQEMENQRNMQSQVTARQVTLLQLADKRREAMLDPDGTLGTVGGRSTRGSAASGGYGNIPWSQPVLNDLNKASQAQQDLYTKIENGIYSSMPVKEYLNPEGQLVSVASDKGFSYLAASARNNKNITDYAKKYGLTVQQAAEQLRPGYSVPLPEWTMEEVKEK